MKLFFTLWALLIASIGSAKVYYVNVKASGSNNGTSWSNAYQDLQKAIDQVPAGSELWIAAGIYHPVAKTKPYAIKKSLHLYGGFAGGESRMEDRDWTRNITRLSGDLQSDDIESYQDHRADNAYHILDISLSGGTVYLDGIYVTNGTGNPSGNSTNLYGIGGGILLSGDLELTHCYFLYNAANYGGAVLLLKGSLTMEDCLFQNNYSAYAGGAIYQPNNHTTLSANACTFRANSSGDTGGAFSANLANTSSLKECLFEENSAARGGAVEVTFGARVTCTNSQFRGNNASYLGGVLFVNGSKSTFTAVNCDFEENTQCCQENGVGGGVGVVAYEALLKFDRCHFNYNSTEKRGGCLLIVDADMAADRSDFTENTAGSGGALYLAREEINTSLYLTDCDLLRNEAAYYGGAIYNESGSVYALGGFMSSNHANEYGGAISSYGSYNSLELSGIRFQQNQSTYAGGAIDLEADSEAFIEDCSFEKNRSGQGGAIASTNDDQKSLNTLTIRRSHFVQNSATEGGAGVSIFNHNLTMVNCLIEKHDIRGSVYDGIIYLNDYDAFSDSTHLINNTFVNNTTTKGFIIEYQDKGDRCGLVIQNNLFDNSGPEVGLEAGQYQVQSRGGNLCASNRMSEWLTHAKDQNNKNPKMGNDYNLLAGSPAIDAGVSAHAPPDDYNGNLRQGPVDAGAFEANGVSGYIVQEPWKGSLEILGNPVMTYANLRLNTQDATSFRVELIAASGATETTWSDYKLPGSHTFRIRIPAVAPGTYWLRVWMDNQYRTQPLIIFGE